MSRPQAHLHAILDLILRHSTEGRRVYSRADGSRLGPGDTLRLPDLAGTLEQLADEGAAALYRGDLARAVVRTVGEGGGESPSGTSRTTGSSGGARCGPTSSARR